MAINVPGVYFECRTCRAPWSEGRWLWGCEECGGAAMSLPCELCLGTCGSTFHRAGMDSNDSGQAHLFGKCAEPGEPLEKARRWTELGRTALELQPPLLELRVELLDWSSDAAWAERPAGPERLRVLRDALQERGFSPSPRALAHALYSWRTPLGAPAQLNLHSYWESAGSLVVLERLPEPPHPSQPLPVQLTRVLRVVADGRSWLSRRPEELPVASREALVPGRRYLALVVPTNMVPGMLLMAHAELTPESELAVIDWHRQLVARGEHPERSDF